MPTTYEPIATSSVSSPTSTVVFSSISSSYTDLKLVALCIPNTVPDNLSIYFNGSTTGYSNFFLSANNNSISEGIDNNDSWIRGFNGSQLADLSYPGLAIFDIFNYTNTSLYKTVHVFQGYTNPGVGGSVGHSVAQWRNTSAINSITIRISGNTNSLGSGVFTLYGIKAA